MEEANKDPFGFKLAIGNTEQLLQAFPNRFEKKIIDNANAPVYVEKLGKNKINNKEERFFATDKSLATIRRREGSVWDLDMDNTELLDNMTKTLVVTKVRVEGDEDSDDFDESFVFDGELINVTYEPYIPETSEYIVRELEERS